MCAQMLASGTTDPSNTKAVVNATGATRSLHESDLVYQGSFRVPHADTLHDANGLGLDYGGTAVGFNPANNSLFMVGHDWDQLSTELGIPATLGSGATVGNWPLATVLQPLTDALEGHREDVAVNTGDKNTKVGGQFVYNGQLYVTTYVYYGASEAHVVYQRSPSLQAARTLIGGMALGPLGPDFYSGYMALVPPEWQSALGGPALIGNCCLSTVARTSYGPAVSAVNPATLTPSAATAATTLLYYPSDHTTLGNWGDPGVNLLFNGSTQIHSVVFPGGTSSVLFFGKQGVGPYCYGEGAECKDPAIGSKGDHAYPYSYYVWAYDAHDLAAVKAGQKQAWAVKPYTVWGLTLPTNGEGSGRIGGAAYDPATGRIFVSQQFGDGIYPVVHVFTVR